MEFFHRYFGTITCEECALAKVEEITDIEKISEKIRDTYQPNEVGDALEHMQRSQRAGRCELHTRQLGRLIYASNDDRFEVDSIRLRRNLEVLTTDNFEKEGTGPAEKKYTFWRVMGQIFLGLFAPLASLFEETPRETQLYKQAGRIATLYKRVKESTNLELFIARIANENSTADPAYSLEEPTETVKLPSDFKWWELTLGIIVPPLFPIVQQNAIERTYSSYMEETEAEIRKLLATGPIHQFILGVFRDDDVYRKRREIDQASEEGPFELPTVNFTQNTYNTTFEGDHERLHREKRSISLPIITELAASAVSSFVGNVVSNLIGLVIEVINPSSNTNRLKRLECDGRVRPKLHDY